MNDFKSNKIIINSYSEIIKKTREEKGKTLNDVAKILNINASYLEALESEQLKKIPKGLYARNYVKEYSFYLGLNPDDILKNFDEINKKEENINLFHRKIPRLIRFPTVSKTIKAIILILIITIIISYLGYYIRNIVSPPDLTIFTPSDNVSIQENFTIIKGKTEPETEIMINGEIVLSNKEGEFEKRINLTKGSNNITISAKKKHSKVNQINKYIFVE